MSDRVVGSRLVRLGWLLIGPVCVITLAVLIARRPGLSWLDPAYGVAVFVTVVARVGDRAVGQASNSMPWRRPTRRFAIRFSLLAGWVWIAVHACSHPVG